MTEAEYVQYLVGRVKAIRTGEAHGDDGPCAATPSWQLVMRLAGERLAAAAVESELVKAAALTESRRVPVEAELDPAKVWYQAGDPQPGWHTCDQATYDAYCLKIERGLARNAVRMAAGDRLYVNTSQGLSGHQRPARKDDDDHRNDPGRWCSA